MDEHDRTALRLTIHIVVYDQEDSDYKNNNDEDGYGDSNESEQ